MQPAKYSVDNHDDARQQWRQPHALPPSLSTATNAPQYPIPVMKQGKFPNVLYGILSNPQFCHVISWMPHCKSWKITNRNAFKKEVCSQRLGIKYESFIKNVNSWGFKRIKREGDDFGSYHHRHFRRDRPNEIELICRLKEGSARGLCNRFRPIHAEPPFSVRLSGPEISPATAAASSVAASSSIMNNFSTMTGGWVPVLNPHPVPMPMYMSHPPPPLPPHLGCWGPPPPMPARLVVYPLPWPPVPSGYANMAYLGHEQGQEYKNEDSRLGEE